MDTLTRMRTFIRVVDSGGFTAAAKALGRSKALISKYVSELEEELGVRLLNRTTRQLSTTEAGERYYREALDILRRLDDLVVEVQDDSAAPRGRLRVSMPRSMGDGVISDALIAFAKDYPDIELNVQMEDRIVNLVEEGFDVAIRITVMDDSSLIAKKVGAFSVVTCASPDVLANHGTPLFPEELSDKPCIIDSNSRPRNAWAYFVDNQKVLINVRPFVEFNSPSVVRRAALSGLGFARIPLIFIWDDLKEGRLVPILEEYVDSERQLHIVYPHRKHLALKTRVFIDYMTDWFSKSKLTCTIIDKG